MNRETLDSGSEVVCLAANGASISTCEHAISLSLRKCDFFRDAQEAMTINKGYGATQKVRSSNLSVLMSWLIWSCQLDPNTILSVCKGPAWRCQKVPCSCVEFWVMFEHSKILQQVFLLQNIVWWHGETHTTSNLWRIPLGCTLSKNGAKKNRHCFCLLMVNPNKLKYNNGFRSIETKHPQGFCCNQNLYSRLVSSGHLLENCVYT